jgi:hypothetical protein
VPRPHESLTDELIDLANRRIEALPAPLKQLGRFAERALIVAFTSARIGLHVASRRCRRCSGAATTGCRAAARARRRRRLAAVESHALAARRDSCFAARLMKALAARWTSA